MCVLTFVVGFAFGALVFSTTREKELESAPRPVVTAEKGYEVLGYTYGGCERLGCASYRIIDDGSYTYIKRSGENGDTRFEDTLSEKKLGELSVALTAADLDAVLATPFTGTCPTTYDALGYRYEIRIADSRYSIDSCREDLESEKLFVMLEDYFEIFGVTHREDQ